MLKNKIKLMCILVTIMLTCVGCWDKVEINSREFVVGIGVDLEEDIYAVTCAIPNLPVYTGKSSGEAKFIKQAKDETITGAYKKLSTRLNKQLDFSHTDVIILGPSVFNGSKKSKELIDHFNRSTEYSRKLPVLLSKKTALEIIQITPEGSGSVGAYIAGIYENNGNNVVRFNSLFLNDLIIASSQNNGNFVIPEVEEGDKDVQIRGGGIVKNFKLIGSLNLEDMKAIGWVKGKSQGSQIKIETEDLLKIVFEINKSNSEFNYKIEDDNLVITIDIFAEGDINEYEIDAPSLYDANYLKVIEAQLEAKMKENIEKVMVKLQDEYQIDVIGLNEQLKIKNKNLYLETKDDWDSYFSDAKIVINPTVRIRRVGDSK